MIGNPQIRDDTDPQIRDDADPQIRDDAIPQILKDADCGMINSNLKPFEKNNIKNKN